MTSKQHRHCPLGILVEDARKYREGRLPACLEAEPAMREPPAISRIEGVLVGEPDGGALVLAVNYTVTGTVYRCPDCTGEDVCSRGL